MNQRRRIMAVVPGMRTTTWAVYGEESPTLYLDGQPDMLWKLVSTGHSMRPKRTSAKKALRMHVDGIARSLSYAFPEVSELWIEGRLDDLKDPNSVEGKAAVKNLALVGALVTMPQTLRTRPTALTAVLVEPQEWREWLTKEYKAPDVATALERMPNSGRFSPAAMEVIGLGLYAGQWRPS